METSFAVGNVAWPGSISGVKAALAASSPSLTALDAPPMPVLSGAKYRRYGSFSSINHQGGASTVVVQSAFVEKPPHIDERRMRHISDKDLFAALDLARPGLHAVRAAVENGDWIAA